jgi:hypothetical protein
MIGMVTVVDTAINAAESNNLAVPSADLIC